MPSENVTLVRSIIDAWNDRGDPSLDAYHDDAEWDFRGWGFNLRGTFHGTESFAQMLEGLREEWDEIRVEAEQYVEAGDRVAFFGRFYSRRPGRSGLEISDSGTCVFTFSEGKIVRFSLLRDRDEALSLLGVPEPSAQVTRR